MTEARDNDVRWGRTALGREVGGFDAGVDPLLPARTGQGCLDRGIRHLSGLCLQRECHLVVLLPGREDRDGRRSSGTIIDLTCAPAPPLNLFFADCSRGSRQQWSGNSVC